jgi:amyloid beta precursor protein binding protein 1
MWVEGEFENTFPPTLIHYYLALRAYDKFLQKYNRPPGSTDDDEDLAIMTGLVDETLGDSPAKVEMVSNACAEMWSPLKESSANDSIRAGGGELHNIASLMGGLVAQEAIKLITTQYIPSDNTCIFDGITSSSNVWAL